jgi:hypothetical protein
MLQTSNRNLARLRDYGQVRNDLVNLRESGLLGEHPLIVSPAHGLPYEWSYPLRIDLPVPAYLDTGWITFSPNYTRVLEDYDIDSLPISLLNRDDVFLMTDSNFTVYLERYYQEHADTDVRFNTIYEMPNRSGAPGYDNIRLYSLESLP